MKNAINYYYGINPTVIHQTGKTFKFNIENTQYVITPCDRVEEINNIYELSLYLIQSGILIHQIIPNKSNQVVTIINEIPYVLMKILIETDRKININDIIYFNNLSIINKDYPLLKRDNWFKLWCDKVDYFEYQINQLGRKHPLIRESFSYYVGLAENGISLLKDNGSSSILTVSHRRIGYNDNLFELYNPLNLVIDFRMRDICEYYKSCFFNNIDITDEVKRYIQIANFNNSERVMFLSRLMYPSYYFDIYEKIMAKTLNDEEIKKIINLVDDYEIFLKDIYLFIKNIDFPDIEWLSKSPLN